MRDVTQPPYGSGGPAPGGPPPPPQNPYGMPPSPPGAGGGIPGSPLPPPAGAYPTYGGPGQQPSKGLAITAFVLSFFACTVVAAVASIVMAVVVLLRGRDGREHGKGFAVAAIVISILSLLATAALTLLVVIGVQSFEDVDDLRTGDCFTAEGFGSEDGYDLIEVVDCGEDHDAEVILAIELDADQAATVRAGEGASLCEESAPAVPDDGTLEFLYLTDEDVDREVEQGDVLACIARRADGEELTSPLR